MLGLPRYGSTISRGGTVRCAGYSLVALHGRNHPATAGRLPGAAHVGIRPARAAPKIVHIGTQKGVTLYILRDRNALQQALAPLGIRHCLHRISRRFAASGSTECRCDRFRHHGKRRLFRASRWHAAGLCRLRTFLPEGRVDRSERAGRWIFDVTLKRLRDLVGMSTSADNPVFEPFALAWEKPRRCLRDNS
jgi:hypothetical protein